MAHQYDSQPRSPASPHFYGPNGMDQSRNGLPSPSSGRFPPIAARGGNFLQPVSNAPSRPVRRPSGGPSLAFPSPPGQHGYPSPASPSQSMGSGRERTSSSSSSPGGPMVTRQSSGDGSYAAPQSSQQSPRRQEQYVSLGAGYQSARPGIGMDSPSTASAYSQPSPKDGSFTQPSSSSPRGPPPSSSRNQHQYQQQPQSAQSSSQAHYDPNGHHAKSASLPSALASPSSVRYQHSNQPQPQQHHQHHQQRTASDPSMRVGGVNSLGGREVRGGNAQLGEVWEEPNFGEDGRLDEVESRSRKMSSSDHRPGQAPSPSQYYPSAVNGGRGTEPPPRPQPPSQGLYSPPDASSSFPTPLHPSRPPNQRGTSSPATGSQSMSAASPASGRKVSFPKASMDVQRSLADGGGYEEFGSSASPKKDKTLTPKKSLGGLRGLFGKRKDSLPSSSPPVPKSSISSPQGTPSTPLGSRTPTSTRGGPDATSSPRMQTDSPASIQSSHTKHSTPPSKLVKRRPSFDSSATPPTASTPFDSNTSPRPSQPPSAFKLAPPPPRPTPERGPNEPTPSSSATFSETSSKTSPTHLAHLRRGSDTSSSSSLSYLAGGPTNPLTRSFSSSPPSNHTARMPNPALHPHLKPSGSLKLLELPSFESGLTFEPSGDTKYVAPFVADQASESVSLGRPLERDDSWAAVFAAGLSVDGNRANRQSTTSTTTTTTTTSDWEGAGELDRAIKDFGRVAPQPVVTAAPPPPPPVPIAFQRKPSPSQAIPPLPVPPAIPKSLAGPLSPPTTPSRKPNHLTIAVGLPETRALPIVAAAEPSSQATPPVLDTAPLQIRRRPSAADQTVAPLTEDVPSYTSLSPRPDDEAEHRKRGSASALAILVQGQQKEEAPPPPLVLPKMELARVHPKRQLLTIQAARLVQTKKPVHHADLAQKMMQCLDSLQTTAARAPLIRGVLLPVLYDDERRGFDPRQVDDNKAMRAACFDWLVTLLQKGIWLEQTANERGAVLEAVAALLESPALSLQALATEPHDDQIFRKIMRTVVSFVMTKLSSKGIFQNTLSFAGRMLAFAFFRVEGIAQQLLSALPVTRMALTRLETQIYESEAASPDNSYVHETAPFPTHLDPFVFEDPRQYLLSIGAVNCIYEDADDEAAFRFQPGNWLRRWQSDDSELFFSFFRAYHKQLVPFFPSLGDASSSKKMKASALLVVPGYAHLATIFATKCLSYIQGKVVSVTTTASSATFNSSETAFAAASGKPNVLENANRRLSETVNYLLATPALVDLEYGTEVEGVRVWGTMSDVWVRFSIGRTNLYEPKGVFCLFDLLDAITAHPPDPFRDTSVALVSSSSDAFSTAFVISTLEIILRNGDHALTLCKCVSFVFQHWETLTANPSDRNRLLELLLERDTFERMALFWSTSVRSYFVRLIVFRLSHVKTTVGQDKQPTETEVLSLKMLNLRLEAVRRRFAELEPSVLGALLEDEEVPPNASTTQDERMSVPGAGLSRSRSTISMIPVPAPSDTSRTSEDGLTPSRENLANGGGPAAPVGEGAGPAEVIAPGGAGAIGKATQWFKKSFASKKKSGRSGSAGSLGAASSSSSIVSGKSLPGISEAAEDDEDGQQQPPMSPTKRQQAYPLFSPLPTVHEPADLLSPTRSSFECSSPASPADSFFSEKQEDALVSADVYRQHRSNANGLALPPPKSAQSDRTSSSDQSYSPAGDLSSFDHLTRTSSGASTATSARSTTPTTGVFSFEFATSPVSDSFEVSSTQPTLSFTAAGTSPLDPVHPTGAGHAHPSVPPSPTSAVRMSRSFSRRSSMLTPLAQNVLESLAEGKPLPQKEKGYDKSRHCYAHRFFAEMEDTLLEYQEWYAEEGPGRGGDGSPPRLTVGWSFNDDD